MGGLLFIAPILAFDVWLTCTTGRRQWRKWREARNWQAMAGAIVAGVFLAIFCTFLLEYKNGAKLRLSGFPVPFAFYSLENDHWVASTSGAPLAFFARLTDFVTGLAAPMIPFKIWEFLMVVKEEINK